MESAGLLDGVHGRGPPAPVLLEILLEPAVVNLAVRVQTPLARPRQQQTRREAERRALVQSERRDLSRPLRSAHIELQLRQRAPRALRGAEWQVRAECEPAHARSGALRVDSTLNRELPTRRQAEKLRNLKSRRPTIHASPFSQHFFFFSFFFIAAVREKEEFPLFGSTVQMAGLRDLQQHRVQRTERKRDRQIHVSDLLRDSIPRLDLINRGRRLGDHAFDLSGRSIEGDSRGEAGFDGESFESGGNGSDVDGVVEAEEGIGGLGIAKKGFWRRRRNEELDFSDPDFVRIAD